MFNYQIILSQQYLFPDEENRKTAKESLVKISRSIIKIMEYFNYCEFPIIPHIIGDHFPSVQIKFVQVARAMETKCL